MKLKIFKVAGMLCIFGSFVYFFVLLKVKEKLYSDLLPNGLPENLVQSRYQTNSSGISWILVNSDIGNFPINDWLKEEEWELVQRSNFLDQKIKEYLKNADRSHVEFKDIELIYEKRIGSGDIGYVIVIRTENPKDAQKMLMLIVRV